MFITIHLYDDVWFYEDNTRMPPDAKMTIEVEDGSTIEADETGSILRLSANALHYIATHPGPCVKMSETKTGYVRCGQDEQTLMGKCYRSKSHGAIMLPQTYGGFYRITETEIEDWGFVDCANEDYTEIPRSEALPIIAERYRAIGEKLGLTPENNDWQFYWYMGADWRMKGFAREQSVQVAGSEKDKAFNAGWNEVDNFAKRLTLPASPVLDANGLAACPMCGGEATIGYNRGQSGSFIECSKCGARTGYCHDDENYEEALRTIWNRRVSALTDLVEPISGKRIAPDAATRLNETIARLESLEGKLVAKMNPLPVLTPEEAENLRKKHTPVADWPEVPDDIFAPEAFTGLPETLVDKYRAALLEIIAASNTEEASFYSLLTSIRKIEAVARRAMGMEAT